MLNSKDAGVILAEIEFIRANGWRQIFLVVEGDDDEMFWRIHSQLPGEAIVRADGVINLRDVMRSLPQHLQSEVCAVADSDFDAFKPQSFFAGCINVFHYDEGFLETFLINSAAFRKVVSLYVEAAELLRLNRARPRTTILSQLRARAVHFARLRILNDRNGWGINFSDRHTPYRYIDTDTWNLDEDALYLEVATAVGCSVDFLRQCCVLLARKPELRMMHGHDALKILTQGWGHAIPGKKIRQSQLLRDLCLAFEKPMLMKKRLWRDLRNWAGGRALV